MDDSEQQPMLSRTLSQLQMFFARSMDKRRCARLIVAVVSAVPKIAAHATVTLLLIAAAPFLLCGMALLVIGYSALWVAKPIEEWLE